MSPLLVICGIIGGFSILVPLWLRPKQLVAAAFLCVLFVRTLTHLSGIPATSNLDDLFVALTFMRAVSHRAKNRESSEGRAYPGLLAFFAFVLCGVVSSALHADLDLAIFGSGLFLATKAVIFGWSVAQFDWIPQDIRRLLRASGWILSAILLATLANLAMPIAWASIFSVNGGIIPRYGLPSLIGPFVHPFDLAFAASMAAVALMAYRKFIANTRLSLVLLIGSSLATFLSFRRKDLLGLLSAFTLLAQRFRWNGFLIAASLVLPLGVIFAWPEISGQFQSLSDSYFTVESQEARTVLTIGAWQLSLSYFPFGAGFGRYASRTAAANYSPEYVRLGFDNVYGLGSGIGRGAFLTDTSWPAVLGETGLAGTLFFVFMLWRIVRAAMIWERQSNIVELRWVGATILGWMVLTIFQSAGAAVFTSPPMFAFLFGLVGIGASLKRYERSGHLKLDSDLEKKRIAK